MGDLIVASGVFTNSYSDEVLGPIWVSPSVGYVVYNKSRDIQYCKTTDGGQTWSDPVVMFTTAAQWTCFGVWFDRWTPGNSGRKIRVVTGVPSGDIFYRHLDTLSDVLGTTITVTLVAPAGSGSNAASIIVTRGGNVLVLVGVTTVSHAFYRSTNDGATWTARTAPGLAGSDETQWLHLHPGDEADDNDAWLVQLLNTDEDLVLKVYDDSDNSWSSTTIASGIAPNRGAMMGTTTRLADNHVIVVCGDATWNTPNNLKAWDIGGPSSITPLGNVLSNVTYLTAADVFIDERTGDLYACYNVGATGDGDVRTYYKKSVDGGLSWGSQLNYSSKTYSSSAPNQGGVWAGRNVDPPPGGRFFVVWFAYNLLFGNYDNSIEMGGGPAYSLRASLSVPYVDEDGTRELHVALENLDPTSKDAGADGQVVVGVEYEPAA